MNVDSLKSELQQVLDNDVVLRKEFNELKRSLSDYRNQLIMRDEDCKRLQVTIDVLNTKLVVMERDNTNYKAELTSFKELRGTIKEQLQSKQEEIDARLSEIQGLRDDINSMAAGYEAQIEDLKRETSAETERLKSDHAQQLQELKTNTHYKENGIKEEFENRVAELSVSWADKEQSLILNHQDQLSSLRETHENEMNSMKRDYDSQISNLSSGSQEELDSLRNSYQSTVSQMEEGFNHKAEVLENTYKEEILNLRSSLEEQRSTLTANFNAQVEKLNTEFSEKESALVAGYEQQLGELRQLLETSSGELTSSFQTQISELKSSHEQLLNETVLSYESRIASLIGDYEEKLSNTLIHSNSQNSKLNEELGRFESENGLLNEKVLELTSGLSAKNVEVADLCGQIVDLESQLKQEADRFLFLNDEFETFKQNALLSSSEQVNELNQQIAALNLSHSDYVGELVSQIDHLNIELKNMSDVFETTTNNLSETEAALESKGLALENAMNQVEQLNTVVAGKEKEVESFKADLQVSVQQEFQNKELEFQKLLAENANIINEIDIAQDKVEAQEAEISILKAELEEMKLHNAGKVSDFKETLANKNFEITNLEANNAALNQELLQLKHEVGDLQSQLQNASESGEQLTALRHSFDLLTGEKNSLLAEIGQLHATVSELNAGIVGLNEKLSSYETEMAALQNKPNTEEQEAFIDRLFKQIDDLNDQRMGLLDEKEQMANQLLKMNEVIGSISQQVESEQINVKDLNNHRMNVILASNSEGESDKPRMKKQINDLVREIDKCIALLSA